MEDINDSSLESKTEHIGKTDFITPLKEFFSFINLGNGLSIPELNGKNIVDIGAGFSDNMSFLRGVLGNDSKIICVDGIYNKKYIDLGIEKTLISTKRIVSKLLDFIRHGNLEKREVAFLNREISYYKNKIIDLKNCDKFKEKTIYKTKLEKKDNIDIAFCKNLFYQIEEPIRFISEILEKLNNNGELIIIDYGKTDLKNIDFLDEMVDLDLIEGKKYKNNDDIGYVIYKIKKENFFASFKKINSIFVEISNN